MILAVTWDAGELRRRGLEALGAAVRLGSSLGQGVALAALGDDSEAVASAAGGFGADRAFCIAGSSSCGSGIWVSALADLARELGVKAIILPGGEPSSEVGTMLAERLGGTAVTNVVDVAVDEGAMVWTRLVFGGKALASVVATTEPVVATIRRGAFGPAEATGNSCPPESRNAATSDGVVTLIEAQPAGTGVPLDQSRIIVSGGRGVGSPEGFNELSRLAELVGGAVGGSLAAVDLGWATTDQQVGLTGKSVSPDVYFAIGISGAAQHLAGIGGARAVVAVNNDRDAPIFGTARLGVVADCTQFVPALIEHLEHRNR